MSNPAPPESLTPVYDELAQLAATGDRWPAQQWKRLAEAGILAIGIPPEFGGSGDRHNLTETYIDLAAADLTSCFILTQQNSAVSRLVASGNIAVKEHWLPRIAGGQALATVGISHLTTSRQHVGTPAVAAQLAGDGYRLNGTVPWSTAATRADVVVVGATRDDGQEILAAVDTNQHGWSPQPPMELLALTASETGEIELTDVDVPHDALVAGPTVGVMRSGAGGAGSVTTSALAAGVSQRAVTLLTAEARKRPDLDSVLTPLAAELEALRKDLVNQSDARPSAEFIRTAANSLVLRSTQALMTACKGAGFMAGHPAERAVREAMFFLVWSCPRPVAAAAMEEFACRPFCNVD